MNVLGQFFQECGFGTKGSIVHVQRPRYASPFETKRLFGFPSLSIK